MNKIDKKTRRNIFLQLLFLAALIAATFWWLLRGCDAKEILIALKGADPRLIGLGILCMAAYIYCGGSSAAVLFRGMGRPMGAVAPAEIPPDRILFQRHHAFLHRRAAV